MSLINEECVQEINNLEEFARNHQTEGKTVEIFRTEEKDSYYLNSEDVRKYPDKRIMEYGFSNPMQLEKLLKEIWGDQEELRELIPTVKVATFKLKDKYDNKFKDLSLYNYTL